VSVSGRRQRERHERQLCILDAAARVFRAKGFSAATMDEVAAKAELSKGTLYLYFKNKDELFLAMASRKVEQVLERLSAVAIQGRRGIEVLGDMLRAYAEVVLEDVEMFRVAFVWLSSGDRVDTSAPAFIAHRERVGRVLAVIIGALATGRADGSVRADIEPRQLAVQIWGGLLGNLMFRANAEELVRRFPHEIDVERLVPDFITLLCDGLRPEEPSS
jgi:AcrR family transcriptional regulator